MDSSKMMILLSTWLLMMLWLAFVVVSGVLAFKKWKVTKGSIREQMLYLWVGAAIVFTGDFLHTIGAPTTARELRIPKKKIIEALLGAQDIRPDRYTILGEQGLTEEAAKKLAKITGVI